MEILQMLILHVFQGILSDYRSLWKKGYPDKKVKAGEMFEICEYGGSKPTKEQLKEFFPGCYIPSDKEIDQWENASLYKKITKLEKRIAKLEGKEK
ncbi:MAG: hypothetical protein GY870_13945 [archaeon]|nr:hypothetical protein [archaeon]